MISIIIPTYNYADFLPLAVESALGQTNAGLPFEVLVVDDGSTDSIAEAISPFGSRISYIRQENKGLSAARNTGMRKALGDFFLFLDADDLLAPGMLAAQWRALTTADAAVAVCLNEEARALGPDGPFWSANLWYLLRGSLPVHLCMHNIAPPHAMLVSRELATRVGWFDTTLRACEDHDFWLRCAVAGGKFIANPQGLVIYRKHASSMSAQKRNQVLHDSIMHERVRNILTTQSDFVGENLPEAWMAHAEGCLQTIITLLTASGSLVEQDIRIVLQLAEFASQAVRQASKALWSNSVLKEHLSSDPPLLQFYGLRVWQHMHFLDKLPFLDFYTPCNNLLRLFPQWNLSHKQLQSLTHDIWQRVLVAQKPSNVNEVIAPVLAAARARRLPRGTAPERPAVLLGSDFFWPSTGGCEIFMEELGRQLLKAGFDVFVATRHLKERSELERDGMRIIPFDCAGRLRDDSLGADFEQYRTFLRDVPFHARIFLGQPDSWMTAPLLEGPLPGKTFLIPVINPELLEDWNRLDQVELVAQVLRHATACLSLTQSGLDKRLMEAAGVTPFFLPHAISEFPPSPNFRERHGFDNTPLLVVVANFWPVKNHLALLPVLQNTPGSWRLALIGNSLPWEGERRYAEAVQALAAADPRVTILGGLPPEEADAAIAAADILLVPSKAECRPLVILQAMRHGTPWIASQNCNSVYDDAGGLICPVERFGEAVTACLTHPGARKALGELGRTHWRERFRWEIILPCFLQLMAKESIETDLTMPQGLRAANANLQRKLLGPNVSAQ